MLFFDGLARVPTDFGPSAVTFGKFDAVHLGHLQVIGAVTDAARIRSLASVVITFDRNPLSVIAPERRPFDLVSRAQKRELLASAGLDAMLELQFDHQFSRQSPQAFIDDVLLCALGAQVVLVGPDCRFGADGAGTFDTLVEAGARRGFEVERLELFIADDHAPASSTRIREKLADGDVAAAGRMLGRHPLVRSVVVHGQKRGRALGYPTANLDPALEGFVPADGVYAGYLRIVAEGEAGERTPGERMPAAISVGNNPTFDGVPEKQVEAFVLDRTLDLYDLTVEVEFVERVRGMAKFDSLNDLIDQMADDTMRVRGILGVVGGSGGPPTGRN